jgi:hypothetical protein
MQFKFNNMYVTLFPIYGFSVGVNYWDTHMKAEDDPHEGEPEYMIQLLIGIFGISFHWWRD